LSRRDDQCMTALDCLIASARGGQNHDLVRMLLPQNAALRKELILYQNKKRDLETPIHAVIRCSGYGVHPKAVEFLLSPLDDDQIGLNQLLCQKNGSQGNSPLHKFCQIGASRDPHKSKWMSPQVIDLLLPPNPVSRNELLLSTNMTTGETPLHLWLENGNYSTVEILTRLIPQEQNSNNQLLCQKNKKGNSPLHKFCQGRDQWMSPIPAMIDLLLPQEPVFRNKLLLSTNSSTGDTPLHLWLRDRDITSLEILMRFVPQGDDGMLRQQLLGCRNHFDKRPVDVALSRHRPLTCAELRYLIPSSCGNIESFGTIRNHKNQLPLTIVLGPLMAGGRSLPELELIQFLWPHNGDEKRRRMSDSTLLTLREEIFEKSELSFDCLYRKFQWTPVLEFFVKEKYRLLEGNDASFTSLHAVTSLESCLWLDYKKSIWSNIPLDQYRIPDNHGRLALHIAMENRSTPSFVKEGTMGTKAWHQLLAEPLVFWNVWKQEAHLAFTREDRRLQLLHLDHSGRLPFHHALLLKHPQSPEIGKDMVQLEPSILLIADGSTGLFPFALAAARDTDTSNGFPKLSSSSCSTLHLENIYDYLRQAPAALEHQRHRVYSSPNELPRIFVHLHSLFRAIGLSRHT